MSTPSLDPLLASPEENLTPRSNRQSIRDFAARIREPRNVLFLVLLALSLFVFWAPLRVLVHYSLRGDIQYDQYSYPVLIPFIGVALVFLERRRIFASVRYCYAAGLILLLAGSALNWFVGPFFPQLGEGDSLSIKILGLVIFWLGGFILAQGTRAFRAGAFPLLFLLLTVPLPDSVLDKPVTAVQYGSTEVCSLIFSLAGVPVLRDGLRFFLPGNAIVVAKECSGIHSTFAIVILSLIAGHLFLGSTWRKVVLILFALPIVCVTNGVRIAGLTLLAEYVDAGFLHGNLHHQGGAGFFLLALLLLTAILGVLRRGQVPVAPS